MSRLPDRHRLELVTLDDRLAVCRLDRGDGIPSWATRGGFFSVTRTHDELSVVCPEASVPEGIRAEKGWRVLRVAGAMDFSLVGVLASLTAPLAEAGVALFALSTFDTDYLLVKEHDLARAIEALRGVRPCRPGLRSEDVSAGADRIADFRRTCPRPPRVSRPKEARRWTPRICSRSSPGSGPGSRSPTGPPDGLESRPAPLAGRAGRPQRRVLRGRLARRHLPRGRRPGRPARRPAPAADGPGGGREAQVPLRPRRAALVRRRRPRERPGRHRPAGQGGAQARRGPGPPRRSKGSGPRPATAARTPPTAARASGSSCPCPASSWTRRWCSATSRSAGATAASRTGSSSATGPAARRSTSAPARQGFEGGVMGLVKCRHTRR